MKLEEENTKLLSEIEDEKKILQEYNKEEEEINGELINAENSICKEHYDKLKEENNELKKQLEIILASKRTNMNIPKTICDFKNQLHDEFQSSKV